MKILNLDGGYFVEPFRRLGHDTLWIGPLPSSDVVLHETLSLKGLLETLDEHDFQPDLVVWADMCRPPSVIGIETLPAVTVGYSIDQYCNPWHAPYSAAFDLMLVAQKDYMGMFDDPQVENEVEWAPLFSNSFKDKDLGQIRNIPIGFVGTVEGTLNKERRDFLKAFNAIQPLHVTQGNYAPVYNRCRIVLNQSAVGELNFRIFEAMGCGAAVLTEDVGNGLSDIFENGRDILLYPRGNVQAAALIARKALATDSLAELAQSGRRAVTKAHSSSVRARRILDFAEKAIGTTTAWRMRNKEIVRKNMGTVYSMLAVDEALPLTQELRDLFIRLGQEARSTQ